MFDLRSLEHSTIIYESADGGGGSPVPLIRLAWNKQVAVFSLMCAVQGRNAAHVAMAVYVSRVRMRVCTCVCVHL